MSRIDPWTLIEKFDGAAHGLPPITLADSPFEAIGRSEHLRPWSPRLVRQYGI